jgi:hypothetical protein
MNAADEKERQASRGRCAQQLTSSCAAVCFSIIRVHSSLEQCHMHHDGTCRACKHYTFMPQEHDAGCRDSGSSAPKVGRVAMALLDRLLTVLKLLYAKTEQSLGPNEGSDFRLVVARWHERPSGGRGKSKGRCFTFKCFWQTMCPYYSWCVCRRCVCV